MAATARVPSVEASRLTVQALDARRIERALVRRTRYRYVQPRVVPEGRGWKVVSPNCSRTVDTQGGEIDIAWLVPVDPTAPLDEPQRQSLQAQTPAGWLLYARDHTQGCWQLKRHETSLAALLAWLCADPLKEFWL